MIAPPLPTLTPPQLEMLRRAATDGVVSRDKAPNLVLDQLLALKCLTGTIRGRTSMEFWPSPVGWRVLAAREEPLPVDVYACPEVRAELAAFLDTWAAAVDAGRVPAFRRNLAYLLGTAIVEAVTLDRERLRRALTLLPDRGSIEEAVRRAVLRLLAEAPLEPVKGRSSRES